MLRTPPPMKVQLTKVTEERLGTTITVRTMLMSMVIVNVLSYLLFDLEAGRFKFLGENLFGAGGVHFPS